MLERVRRNSILKPTTLNASTSSDTQMNMNENQNEADERFNSMNNQYTFSPTRRTSVFSSETIRKMHSAVEINKKLLEKSKEASLVLMNIPAPPKSGSSDFNCN